MIINKVTAENYLWGNNCQSWVLHDHIKLSVKQERMPSKSRENCHFHEKATQFFYILKGNATFYLENEKIQLKSNDGLTVKVMQKHYIANETNEEIEFLVISQPNTNNDRIDL